MFEKVRGILFVPEKENVVMIRKPHIAQQSMSLNRDFSNCSHLGMCFLA
jgi:hypothetical protein